MEERMIKRRRIVLAVGASAFTLPCASLGQKYPSAVPHIAYLSQGSPADRGVFLGAFRDGLRELGWIDGKNIVIDVHWAPAYEFPQVAASVVERNPAAIVGTCIPSTRAAKNATATIPVVMSVNGDPVESGLVASLARPSANVTGTWTLFEDLIPKWLEIITTAVPDARTVAVLVNPESVGDEYWWTQIQQAAKQGRVNVVRAEAQSAAGLERVFAATHEQRAEAVVTMADAYFLNEIQRIVTLASVYKLPAVYGFREYAEAGGLISYGLSYRDYFKGVARYVDKVLRGTKPADLPVTQPTKIELVINLNTATLLGLKIPQPLLLRADEVIQ
jgi:putative ABC transport system substrate-binding protein